MKKTHLFILPLCALFLFSTCKKDESENCSPTSEIPGTLDSLGLPPATTTGANTMGCLINGEPWLPLRRNIFGNLFYSISFTVGSQSSGGGVSIQARRKFDDIDETMNFSAFPAEVVGTYPYQVITNNFLNSNCGLYDLDTTQNNFIEITRLDFEEEIISGQFQMTVFSENCQDTLHITNGRFDLSP